MEVVDPAVAIRPALPEPRLPALRFADLLIEQRATLVGVVVGRELVLVARAVAVARPFPAAVIAPKPHAIRVNGDAEAARFLVGSLPASAALRAGRVEPSGRRSRLYLGQVDAALPQQVGSAGVEGSCHDAPSSLSS